MNRFAVLVDAGYLLSQAVQILSNQQSKSRKDLAIHDPQALITNIIEHSMEVLGNRNLLRVYWYDGVAGRLSSEQEALSLLPDVQFRQGTISKSGLQKGVDSKIMADLIELSSNQAISDAVLVTGDGDLVVGLDLAQRRGVRVAVLGIEDAASGVTHNQSFEMVCAADRVRRMSRTDIAPHLSYAASATSSNTSTGNTKELSTPVKKTVAKKTPVKKPSALSATKKTREPVKPTSAPAASPHLDELPAIVKLFIEKANPPFESTVVTPTGALGQAIDSKLLKAATEALRRKPMPSERAALRRLFRESF